MFNFFSKSDLQIQKNIVRKLNWELDKVSKQVTVDVIDGIVTLRGCVPQYFEKSKASEAAQRVRGVRNVADEIEVFPIGISKRSDAQIAESALNALEWSYSVPKGITVVVEKGWVTLIGQVEWEHQRIAAKNAVAHLIGVCGITSRIGIGSKSLPEEIKFLIEDTLKYVCDIEDQKIAVSVEGCKATLTGYVYSFSQLKAASEAAWMAPGILTVENNLQISQ